MADGPLPCTSISIVALHCQSPTPHVGMRPIAVNVAHMHKTAVKVLKQSEMKREPIRVCVVKAIVFVLTHTYLSELPPPPPSFFLSLICDGIDD